MNIHIESSDFWTQVALGGAWDCTKAAEFFHAFIHGDYGGTPLLLDLDALTEFPPVDDLLALFEGMLHMKEAPPCALLAQKPVSYGLGRMVTTLAGSRGLNLALFRSHREAERFLLPQATPAAAFEKATA